MEPRKRMGGHVRPPRGWRSRIRDRRLIVAPPLTDGETAIPVLLGRVVGCDTCSETTGALRRIDENTYRHERCAGKASRR